MIKKKNMEKRGRRIAIKKNSRGAEDNKKCIGRKNKKLR